jgi:8-oxo-dGTP pyrophosphatase MutT (NUDIX family)
MSLHARACAVLAAFDHREPAQRDRAVEYRDFLEAHADGVWRECRVGHITASALVVDSSGEHILLTLHPKVRRWLQLGGHLELQDAGVREGAVREVIEESGLRSGRISAAPVRLDRHLVPCGRGSAGERSSSEHLDMQFIVQARELFSPVISSESEDLRWFSRTELPPIDASVTALIDDAREFLRATSEDPDRWVDFG